MQWSTLPSECRQRKDLYLASWGDRGGKASTFLGLPRGIDPSNCIYAARIPT
jgi:hypothetical protein